MPLNENDELAFLSLLKEDTDKRYAESHNGKKMKNPDDPESYRDIDMQVRAVPAAAKLKTSRKKSVIPRINFDDFENETELYIDDEYHPRSKPVYLGDDAAGIKGNYEVCIAQTINEETTAEAESYAPIQQEKRLFIYDKRTEMYHSSTGLCCRLMGLDKSNGIHFLKQDVKNRICPLCLPSLNASICYQPKDKLTQSVLKAYCEQQNMHIEFVGSIAYVTTIAGEWYFDYTIREPAIHHRSIEKREVAQGKISHYHIQRINTKTALTAVMHIYRHDQAAIRRLMGAESKSRKESTLAALVHHLCVDAGIEIDDLLDALGITRREWALWMSEGMLTVQIETISFIADFFEIDSGEFLNQILQFAKEGACDE